MKIYEVAGYLAKDRIAKEGVGSRVATQAEWFDALESASNMMSDKDLKKDYDELDALINKTRDGKLQELNKKAIAEWREAQRLVLNALHSDDHYNASYNPIGHYGEY